MSTSRVMENSPEKILVLESGESSRRNLEELLVGAGYEVSTECLCEQGLKAAREQGMHLLLLDSALAGLDCANVLAELKGAAATSGVRVILLEAGGASERARGLDLGADDVVSRPWDSQELLARVRAQLRAKRAADNLHERTLIAEQGQELARTAFTALAVTEKMTRDAFTLGRGLKIGLIAVFAGIALMIGIYVIFSRRVVRETQRTYSVIARLNLGLTRQEDLLERTRRMSEQMGTAAAASAQAQKQPLENQSRQLRARRAQAPGESPDLRGQIEATQARLRQVEAESSVAQGIIQSYAPSVCLIHVAVSFRDQGSDRRLRYVGLLPDGQPIHDTHGEPLFTLEGAGPEVRADFFGTGFLVSAEGRILTNHHVVEPWWNNDDLSSLTEQGLTPVVAEMYAYFPTDSNALQVATDKISSEADVAVVLGNLGNVKRQVLSLDGRKNASVSGQPVVLMGYPTGIEAVLARADGATVQNIVTSSHGSLSEILLALAQKKLIRPIVTQGHLGDVLPDRIVYDAQTTSGGSGGPLFNKEGKVIGINYAVLKNFGGSNFGIPARYAERLVGR
jgi:DNA-binding response OmpR family regulator/S1-C subfamily serine protease